MLMLIRSNYFVINQWLDGRVGLRRRVKAAVSSGAWGNYSALLPAHSPPSPTKDLRAGITSLQRLSVLFPLLPVLKTLCVCTAPTERIIGENLTRGLCPELNESPSKEDTISSITDSSEKLTDGSKP
ncbi:hypothetical protein AYI68_g4853 [Smittium mucronatum]|uniref:Uncharacterized protein n=1 Tax=Smittium mucronatum TaxID=133383 RepID=A0A1R0GW00_9FUNG|nr:hypothetical protein AYI68_g4853 [Smittium mucronatum]